jgi:hypothetical protein
MLKIILDSGIRRNDNNTIHWYPVHRLSAIIPAKPDPEAFNPGLVSSAWFFVTPAQAGVQIVILLPSPLWLRVSASGW